MKELKEIIKMCEETIKKYVEEVLEELPETRGNDTLLQFNVLKRMGFAEIKGTKIIIDLEIIDKMPSFESIRRLRQLIQSPIGENRLYPSKNIEKQRKDKEERYREIYSTKRLVVNEMPNSWMS